jgi:hypothetical protein
MCAYGEGEREREREREIERGCISFDIVIPFKFQ